MIIGIAPDGTRRSPHLTGERGTCPGCEQRIDAVVGEIVIPHWRHVGNRDCDSWAEGETDWHGQWKIEAKQAGFQVEVTYREPIHRADAVSPTGIVYEFQHSGLTPDELLERSTFYDQRGPLIWVFDANGPWRRRWHRWREEGQGFFPGLMAMDEGPRLWLMSNGDSHPIQPWELFSARTQAAARREWVERRWRCATCGAPPASFFPDGSATSRCSHDPLRVTFPVPASAG
jgi:hypothetical protein